MTKIHPEIISAVDGVPPCFDGTRGEVNFRLSPLFVSCSVTAGESIPAGDLSPNKNIPVYGSNGTRGYSDFSNFTEDQVLVGRQGSVGSVHLAKAPFWAAEHALVVKPLTERIDKRWLKYVLEVSDLGRLSRAVAQPGINATSVSFQRIPHVEHSKQVRIADYLERETAEIDAAVVDLDKYVQLLEKRKSIAIENAVEGSQTPLHCMTRIVDCVHTTPDRDENGVAEAVRTSSIRSGKYVPGMGIPISAETVSLRNKELAPKSGDLFFTREAPAGEACLVPTSGTFAAGQRVVTIRPDESVILPEYLLFALYSAQIRERWTTTSTGSTVTNIKMATIGQARIPTPSISRQYEIVQSLDQEFTEIENLIAESTKLRDLLLKRRSVLITEVVTGRKQV